MAEDAVLVEEGREPADRRRLSTLGPGPGSTGSASPTPLPPRRRNTSENLQPTQTEQDEQEDLSDEEQLGNLNLSDEQIKTAAASIGLTEETFLAGLRQKRTDQIVHPEWTGNIAASKEERAFDGYADIERADNRIVPDTSIHPVG